MAKRLAGLTLPEILERYAEETGREMDESSLSRKLNGLQPMSTVDAEVLARILRTLVIAA